MPILDLNKFSTLKGDEQTCKHCGGFMYLIPRLWSDRFLNFLSLGTKRKSRFKCKSCNKEIIKNHRE